MAKKSIKFIELVLKSHEKASITYRMSPTTRIPDDPSEYQRLLEDLLRRNDELRQQAETAQQQAETAQQRAEEAQRRIDELERVLDQTAADYDQLKEEHTELAETLALLRRYVFGPRRERFIDAPGQGHLFDIPEITIESGMRSRSISPAAAKPSTATRSPRRTRLDHLPHIRIPHDVPEAEKTCSCCGGPKTRIGEDESRELDTIPGAVGGESSRPAQVRLPQMPRRRGQPTGSPPSLSRAGSPGRDWSRT